MQCSKIFNSNSCPHLPRTAFGPVHHSIPRGSLRHVPTVKRLLSTESCATTKIEREAQSSLSRLREEGRVTGALSRETWGAPGTYSQLVGLAVSVLPVIHSLPLHQGTQAQAFALAKTSKLTSSPFMDSRIGRKTETWLTQTAASCILRSRRGRPLLCHTDPTCQSSSLLPTPDSIPIGRLAYPEKGSTAYENNQTDERIRPQLGLAKTVRSREERRDGHVAQPVEDLCPPQQPKLLCDVSVRKGPVSPCSSRLRPDETLDLFAKKLNARIR